MKIISSKTGFVTLGIAVTTGMFILANNNETFAAGDTAVFTGGDLKVDGIHFSADGSVVRKLADLTSQWTTSNLDIYYAGGNVGIGTLTPTQKLSVAGTIESTSGGFKFPDGSVLSSANISSNYILKNGDTMNGTLSLPANGLQMAGGQIVTSGGGVGFGSAPKPESYIDISGTYTAATYTSNLLQIDGTAKSNGNYAQAYLRGLSISPTFDVSAGYANYLVGIETYMGFKTGANVAHTVVGYSLNGQPSNGLECNVGFGISVPNQQTSLCNGKYGFYQGDASAQYNYFASNVGIGTPFPNQALTVQGNVQVSGDLNVSGNLLPSGGRLGFGAAAKPEAYFDISGAYTAATYTSNLLQIDGTAKSNGSYAQAYLRGLSISPTFDVSDGYANYLVGIETYMGNKVGANVAHTVVGYSLNGQPSGGSECSVGFGISVPNQQTSLCNGRYGFYQGDASAQYNYFASNVGIGTPFPTQALTVQGNVQASGNINATGTGTMPVYSSSGTAQTAPHMVTGVALISSANVTVSLSGTAVFSNASSYTCTSTMQGSFPLPVSVQILSGSSFTIFGNAGYFNYICVGN